MSVFQWLVLIAIIGAVLIVAVPNVYRHYWNRAHIRGFRDWVNYRAGVTQYPVANYWLPSYSRAYTLGMRQAQGY